MNVVKIYFFFQAFTLKVQGFEKSWTPLYPIQPRKDSSKPPTYPSKE